MLLSLLSLTSRLPPTSPTPLSTVPICSQLRLSDPACIFSAEMLSNSINDAMLDCPSYDSLAADRRCRDMGGARRTESHHNHNQHFYRLWCPRLSIHANFYPPVHLDLHFRCGSLLVSCTRGSRRFCDVTYLLSMYCALRFFLGLQGTFGDCLGFLTTLARKTHQS